MVAAPAAAGTESAGADAGLEAQASQDGSHGQMPQARPRRRALKAGSKVAPAAAGSRGSRGRSHGKGAAASEVTHSEVTKDSVGIGSRDGQQRRVAGLPMPVVTAPAQGEMGILATRQISHGDTVGTADFAPVDAMTGDGDVVWSFGASLGGEGAAEMGQEAAATGGPVHAGGVSAGSGGEQEPAAVADRDGGRCADAAGLGSDELDADAVCRDSPQAAVREAVPAAAERGTTEPGMEWTAEAEAGVNSVFLMGLLWGVIVLLVWQA